MSDLLSPWLRFIPSLSPIHLWEAREEASDPDLPPMVVGAIVSALSRHTTVTAMLEGKEQRAYFYVLGTNIYAAIPESLFGDRTDAFVQELKGICDAFFDVHDE